MNSTSPAAYLITFSTYGSWLHGDPRGSHHHRTQIPLSAAIPPSPRWQATERARLTQPPVRLGPAARCIVERVALEVCEHRGWSLLAAHARTTHVHVLITARAKPEDVLRTIKAWATRRLVEAGAAAQGSKVWSRHGSTVYLWSGEAVERAEWYVRYEQDEGTGWG